MAKTKTAKDEGILFADNFASHMLPLIHFAILLLGCDLAFAGVDLQPVPGKGRNGLRSRADEEE
jgi:hypothetical protein